MSQSKLGNYVFIKTDAVAVHAPATSQTAQSLVGRTRWIWEHTTGASAVPGEPAVSPKNPQGEIGADLSGPPFGAAPRHVVATLLGDTVASANARAHRGRFYQYELEEQLFSSGLRRLNLEHVRFYNRNHTTSENFKNPYQTLGFFYEMDFEDAAGTTTYRWTLKNKTTGKEATVTQTNSAMSGVSPSGSTAIICAPGWNEMEIFLWRESGPVIWTTVKSAVLCNMVKRKLGTA